MLIEFFGCHDFNVPTAKFGSQTNILSTATDGQRKLVFADQNNGTTDHIAKQNLLDFRRLELDHPGASRSKPGEQARAGGKHVAVASSVPSQYPVAHHGVLYS